MENKTKNEITIELEHPVKMKITGDIQDLLEIDPEKAIRLVSSVNNIQQAFGVSVAQTTPATATSGFPSLSIGSASVTDGMNALLATDWFNQPRTLAEIHKALEVNAIFCPEGQVSDRLTKMTRQGRFRRVPSEEGYRYGRGTNFIKAGS